MFLDQLYFSRRLAFLCVQICINTGTHLWFYKDLIRLSKISGGTLEPAS